MNENEAQNIPPYPSKGDSFDIKLIATAKDSEDLPIRDFKWSSSNTKIATVDDNGHVQVLSKGTVTITASAIDGSNVKFKLTFDIK